MTRETPSITEQDPVLTVTLNPALDLAADCDTVRPNRKLRVSKPHTEPGGGGVNVSRAIALLGGDSTALVAWGGAIGAWHRRLLEAEGIRVLAHELGEETRQSLTVTDAEGSQFRFVLPGPDWTADDARTVHEAILRAAPHGLVVLSGSQPPGVHDRFPADLAAALGPRRLIVDTSGAALRALVATPRSGARPFVLRMDQAEAEALAGHDLDALERTHALAARLVARKVAEIVVVARGADGSVLASAEGAWHCVPPQVPVRSKVGAGDSFTGALTLALARAAPLPEALRQGVAAAAGAVMTEATALCRPADVARIAADSTLRALPARAGA